MFARLIAQGSTWAFGPASILRNLAASRKRQRAEERAMRALDRHPPSTLPWIMPSLFIDYAPVILHLMDILATRAVRLSPVLFLRREDGGQPTWTSLHFRHGRLRGLLGRSDLLRSRCRYARRGRSTRRSCGSRLSALDADQIVVKIVPSLSPSRPLRAGARGRSWNSRRRVRATRPRARRPSPGRPGPGPHHQRRQLYIEAAARRCRPCEPRPAPPLATASLLDGKVIDVVARRAAGRC